MTYNQIRKEIEGYEKAARTAFFINGEHGTNEEKKELLRKSFNQRDAAISALFDSETIYMKNSLLTNEEKENFVRVMKESFKLRKKKLSNEEIIQLEEFEEVYFKLLEHIFDTTKFDFLKIIKYSKEKREQHLQIDARHRRREENIYIHDLIGMIKDNYNKYYEDKNIRKNHVHHVGTSSKEINQFINLITKEEVIYKVLMEAVNKGLEDKEYMNKEEILKSYEKIDIINSSEFKYFDKEAYDQTLNCFDLYNDTYKNVYLLEEFGKKKVKRLLKNKR